MKDTVATRFSRLANEIDADDRFVDAVMARVGRTMPRKRRHLFPSPGLVLVVAASVLIGMGIPFAASMGSKYLVGSSMAGSSQHNSSPVKLAGLNGAEEPTDHLLSLDSATVGDRLVGIVVAVDEQWSGEGGVILVLSSARPSEATLNAFGTPLFSRELTRQELTAALNRKAASHWFTGEPLPAITVSAASPTPLKDLIARLGNPAERQYSPFTSFTLWNSAEGTSRERWLSQ